MAHIQNHYEFIRSLISLMEKRGHAEIANQVRADRRDKMTEPDYFGLEALGICEQYFDALDPAEVLSGFNALDPAEVLSGCAPLGSVLAIVRWPGEGTNKIVPAHRDVYDGSLVQTWAGRVITNNVLIAFQKARV